MNKKILLSLILVSFFASFKASAFVLNGYSTRNSPRIFAIKFQTHDGKPMVAFQMECAKFKNINGRPVAYYENCHTYALIAQEKVDVYFKNAQVNTTTLDEAITQLKEKAKVTAQGQDVALVSMLGGPIGFTLGWLYALGNTIDYGLQESEILEKNNMIALLIASGKDVGFYVNLKEFEQKLVNELNQIITLN